MTIQKISGDTDFFFVGSRGSSGPRWGDISYRSLYNIHYPRAAQAVDASPARAKWILGSALAR